jgi:hypothetical protein
VEHTSIESAWEHQVLTDLLSKTYEEVAASHSCSRGTIYRIALKHGARKTEQRIIECQATRQTAPLTP